MKGSCLIGQSGGPSAVINSSAYGAVAAALEAEDITRVLAARHGVKGILDDDIFDLGAEDPEELALLQNTPSSAFGSCRYKLADPDKDDKDFRHILEIFKKYDVRYFFYIGGNDSMDTCEKVGRYMKKAGYDCRVMGIPKTIDNDLSGTDHCPGYGSAARYIATTCMEVSLDMRVYDTGAITVMEIMGRNAGWLTAAAALASLKGAGPDLIYLPETDFDMDAFLTRVNELYKKQNSVFVAVSEGIHDAEGTLISEYASKNAEKDAFGHVQLGGLAAYLADVTKKATGAKVRGIELSLLQRCAAHCASQTDIDEARRAGEFAVKQALEGKTGCMVAFKRGEGAYSCETVLIPLAEAANFEKKIPAAWITDGGVTQEFIDYAEPLVQGEPSRKLESSLPRFAKLRFVRA